VQITTNQDAIKQVIFFVGKNITKLNSVINMIIQVVEILVMKDVINTLMNYVLMITIQLRVVMLKIIKLVQTF
jgi:hypothetical protein